MQKAILFGMNAFSRLLRKYLAETDDMRVTALTAESAYISKDVIEKWGEDEIPIIPFENLEEICPPDEYGVLVCIGYSQMNSVRERVFKIVREKGYRIMSYIHPTATVLADRVGDGTIVMERALIGAFVTMGEGNIFYPASHIAHDSVIGDFNFFSISCSVAGHVSVGNNCFLGNNCTTKNGIRIGDYTLVGAGCYLSKSSEPYSVYVPARSVLLEGKDSRDMHI